MIRYIRIAMWLLLWCGAVCACLKLSVPFPQSKLGTATYTTVGVSCLVLAGVLAFAGWLVEALRGRGERP